MMIFITVDRSCILYAKVVLWKTSIYGV